GRGAGAARKRGGRRSEDQERQERERREQPHHPKGAARRGPQAEERCGTGDPLPAAVAHVRDQLDVAKAALERSHPAGYFRRSRQREPPTSRSERALNRRERADLRLPGGVVGVAARSEEHTSELQSHLNLVCRLLLEKKK